MELDDMLKMKMLEGGSGMSPYETFKTQHMQAKSQTSGLGIAGLTVAVGAGVAAIAGALWAGAKAKNAKDVAEAKNDGLRDLILTQAQTIAAERNERINGDLNITTTISDTLSGSQQGSLSASQIATNEATAQIVAGVMTGKYTESPQKVELLTPAQPFQCGCGCGN